MTCVKIIFPVDKYTFFKFRFLIRNNNIGDYPGLEKTNQVSNNLCGLNSQVFKKNVSFFYQEQFLLTHVSKPAKNECQC